MKKKAIFLALLVYVIFAGYGQDNSLGEATLYYNNNDYINAKSSYLKAFKEDNYNGEALYRFAYTNEMLDGLNGKVLDLYAAAYFYLSNDGSNDQYLEWSGNKLSNNSYAIDSITTEKVKSTIAKLIEIPFIDGTLDGSFLRKFVKPTMISKLSDIMVVLIIIALIIYSAAIILSKKTNCVIIWGWWDLLLVAIPGFLLIYYLVKMNTTIEYDSLLNFLFFFISIITFTISIIINIKYSGVNGLFFAMLSILSKLIIMILIPIIIFLFLMAISSGKKDRRYRDGTKGNEMTKWVAVVSAIAIFLIANLVKSEKLS